MSDEELLKLCDGVLSGREVFQVGEFSDEGAVASDVAKELAAALRDRIERERWIPVAERLPDAETPVQVVSSTRRQFTAIWRTEGRWASFPGYYGSGVVTHWKPLPAPATEGGGE